MYQSRRFFLGGRSGGEGSVFLMVRLVEVDWFLTLGGILLEVAVVLEVEDFGLEVLFVLEGVHEFGTDDKL
jgi:hypothetical protein